MSRSAGSRPMGPPTGALIATLPWPRRSTCDEHVLQRAVLFALGIAGASSLNLDTKKLLRKHARVVQLGNQNLKMSKGIREAQLAAGVPDHALLAMVRTMPTRWGNQFVQLQHNRKLRLAIDPVMWRSSSVTTRARRGPPSRLTTGRAEARRAARCQRARLASARVIGS